MTMTTLLPVEQRRTSLVTEIQAQLRDYIFANGLQPGDMLPPAAEMATAMAVSPTSLREGLRAMEALGLVEIRHGVGIFVRAYNLTPILENLTFSLLFEKENLSKLIQIREAMEVGLIREAMAQMSDETVAELERLLHQMASDNARHEIDIEFHRTIYRDLHNELIAQFLDIFWMVHRRLFQYQTAGAALLAQTWRDHEAIFLAIKARDTEAVTLGLRQHFQAARSRIEQLT